MSFASMLIDKCSVQSAWHISGAIVISHVDLYRRASENESGIMRVSA